MQYDSPPSLVEGSGVVCDVRRHRGDLSLCEDAPERQASLLSPYVTNLMTRALDGLARSRFGPIVPFERAAFIVWHAVQPAIPVKTFVPLGIATMSKCAVGDDLLRFLAAADPTVTPIGMTAATTAAIDVLCISIPTGRWPLCAMCDRSPQARATWCHLRSRP
jgi:hypothetical protein